jgi:hypothetical protein
VPEPIRVLLDEGVPERLRSEFSEAFVVETVRHRGWRGTRNGDLLHAAEATFDALVTVDKRLRYQQNVRAHAIAVVVLDALGTKFSDLLPLVPAVEAALRRVKPGEVVIVAR